MAFKQDALRFLVLAVVSYFCEAQAPAGFWPHALMPNHQLKDFLKPVHYPMYRPRGSSQLAHPHLHPTPEPIPLPDVAAETHKPVLVQPSLKVKDNDTKLPWTFPAAQRQPTHQSMQLELQEQPRAAKSIAVKCGDNTVQVEVKRDFFGTGQWVDPSSITLGGCAATAEDAAAGVLVFHSALQGCNSRTQLTEDVLVYTFSLVYKPHTISGLPIVRTRGAAVGIECHYVRKHNVSSNALQPTWMPYASTEVAKDFLVFSLRLMTDDWRFERPSNVYYLGQVMNIEASVTQFHHVPLRVFVDNCVASASPNTKADPRYSFIENHGCFNDGKIANSSFLPRRHDGELQFNLEAFQFQEDTGSVYITCMLKATPVSSPTDVEHKACSFTANSWIPADHDQVCNCCNTKCEYRHGRHLAKVQGLQWEAEATIGPIVVLEK
ncbi:zona pellucida sperm-binding protein 3-like [Brachyhypopomus gauderio]|uniref:zona pellucida sperm-binding protein 3-like n=1 Tax=Brachyhypopomus gauderio TaxID=698409 RepID=UPI004043476C